jgi:hypothetical protein
VVADRALALGRARDAGLQVLGHRGERASRAPASGGRRRPRRSAARASEQEPRGAVDVAPGAASR